MNYCNFLPFFYFLHFGFIFHYPLLNFCSFSFFFLLDYYQYDRRWGSRGKRIFLPKKITLQEDEVISKKRDKSGRRNETDSQSGGPSVLLRAAHLPRSLARGRDEPGTVLGVGGSAASSRSFRRRGRKVRRASLAVSGGRGQPVMLSREPRAACPAGMEQAEP